jgi:hypothetical protein
VVLNYAVDDIPLSHLFGRDRLSKESQFDRLRASDPLRDVVYPTLQRQDAGALAGGMVWKSAAGCGQL